MFELTRLESSAGLLTKRIRLSPDGQLVSDGSACCMVSGAAQRVHLTGVHDLAALIMRLGSNQAIALGAMRSDLPDAVEVVTQKKLSDMESSTTLVTIARTAEHIAYNRELPAFALLDYDSKGMPPAIRAKIELLGGFLQAVLVVVPALTNAARLQRSSTSSGLSRADTGEAIAGSDGAHVFLAVQDGGDVKRFLTALHNRCWLNGLGWMMVGAGGQFLERSIVDRMVYAGERLVFEGAPTLEPPLIQDAGLRKPFVTDGESIDSAAACRDLTLVEQSRLDQLKAAEQLRLQAFATVSRSAFIRDHAARIRARTGVSSSIATRAAESQCDGVLLPHIDLAFDAQDLAHSTVADVLANPDRFVGATLADPLEGIAYGRCKAMVMRRSDGSLWIRSFAHGCSVYQLRYDAAAVERALRSGEPAAAVDGLISMLHVADLRADEEQRLRELAGSLAQVKPRALSASIKAARADISHQRWKDESGRAAAARNDGRIGLTVPSLDAERLPVLAAIDEVLRCVDAPEPPMRDLYGEPIEIRTRAPALLHELTAFDANLEEARRSTALPAPEMPLLTKHDRFSMAHLIERHIRFEAKGGETPPPRAVALPQAFTDHYLAYRDSSLPQVGSILTTPLVLPDGELLAKQGIDAARKLVFRLEPELLRLLPMNHRPSDEEVATAQNFLVNDWLCDVATDYVGKCVLIAMALTILERTLLPERPAFFVTAGKRGGGKTTALTMVILAVTGRKPAAAGWSSSEEERRKALTAYLSEGLPAMVFDNVPLGTTISCPTIEKILTAEIYSDRMLGHTVTMEVQAFTVLSFTGNNISPKGDLASRSLMVRLAVDRPDPENRIFRHADPVAYTIRNRGEILTALYVILLGNPQLRSRKPPKTRFKMWWHLIGSALEFATACLITEGEQLGGDDRTPAQPLDFTDVFRNVEGEDEEAVSLGDALDALKETWPTNYFSAAEVAKLINDPMAGEQDIGARLQGFFSEGSSRRADASTSAIQIGKRLGRMVDTPIPINERTLMLIKNVPANQAAQRHSARYHVKQLE